MYIITKYVLQYVSFIYKVLNNEPKVVFCFVLFQFESILFP